MQRSAKSGSNSKTDKTWKVTYVDSLSLLPPNVGKVVDGRWSWGVVQLVFDELPASSVYVPLEYLYAIDQSLSVTPAGCGGFRPRTGRVPASGDVITRGDGHTTSVERRPLRDLRMTLDRRRQQAMRSRRKRTSRPAASAAATTTVAVVDRRSRLVQRSSSTDDVRFTTLMSTWNHQSPVLYTTSLYIKRVQLSVRTCVRSYVRNAGRGQL